MVKKSLKIFTVMALISLLAGCLSFGPLSYKQKHMLKKEGFVLTEEGWSLGLPERLLFGFNEAEINPNQQGELKRLAAQLQKYKLSKVKIVGHTDNVGNPEYNLKLSEKRAESVAEIFIGQRFDPNNVNVIGRGSSQPITDNLTEEHRAENRRVAVIIIP